MVAAANDRPDAAAALMKRGAALETRNDYGRTARVLIEVGADIDAADKRISGNFSPRGSSPPSGAFTARRFFAGRKEEPIPGDDGRRLAGNSVIPKK